MSEKRNSESNKQNPRDPLDERIDLVTLNYEEYEKIFTLFPKEQGLEDLVTFPSNDVTVVTGNRQLRTEIGGKEVLSCNDR